MKKNKRNHGFTLFEVMASFVILAIILYALYVVFDQTSQVVQKGTNTTDEYQNARVALYQIFRDLSQIVVGQGGPTAVSNHSKNSSYLLGTNGSKTVSGNSYDRDGIFFSVPIKNGFNEIGYYISNNASGHLKDDFLQRLKSARDSNYMGFSVDNISTTFGENEKFGFYITDLQIQYKIKETGSQSGQTFNEWDSRFNSLGGTTSTTRDDGRLPDSIVITVKTVSKEAIEKSQGVPEEGIKKTFSIEVPMTETTTYQMDEQ
ncbi:type II secretion system protein J [Chlamydiota bacterium]